LSARAEVQGAGGRNAGSVIHPTELGMWFFLGTVTMLFAAFVSAYLIRRVSGDWQVVELPGLLWWNSMVLILSSLQLEGARQALARDVRSSRKRLLGVAVLGVVFIAGQAMVWQQLAAQGVYIPSSPHAAFFYLLTALHLIHVTAGILLLIHVWRGIAGPAEYGQRLFRIAGAYWHYMGGLWIFLFLVLSRL
jgi:cytochrome c oxidase subunit 3